MKKRAKQLMKNPLIYGSAIVVFGGLFANLLNFFFNLFMLRNLSTADYGILATVIAMMSYPALITTAVGPLIIRFAGEYYANGKLDMVRGLYIKILKGLLIIAVSAFILFWFFIPQLGSFFHINDPLVLVITNFIIFLTFISFINAPFIQAKLAFSYLVITNFAGALTKLIAGVLLVLAGFAAKGAVLSVFLAIVISYIISFIPLKFIFNKNIVTPTIKTNVLLTYGIPSGLTLFSLNSFIGTDILLVKHFFDPHQAGLYAGISLVSRVIFFLLFPISTVMFPIIVQKHAKKENYTNTFKLSLFLVFFPSILLTIFYTVFPEFTLMFFTGGKKEYLEMSSLIGYFGLFVSLYTVLNIIANFYLSIKKTNIFLPITLGAIAQVVLIFLYHETFFQIIMISLVITFLLVVGLLLYYPHATKK